MAWLAWILVGVLTVALVCVIFWQSRSTRRFIEERVLDERRSRNHADELHRQASEAAERVRVDAQRILDQAKEHAAQATAELDRRREELEVSMAARRAELREQRAAQERQEERLHEKEDRLSAEAEGLATRAELLEQQRRELRQRRDALGQQEERIATELERIAGLGIDQAHEEVLARAERQARLEAATLARDIEETARHQAEVRAREIIVTAIQRCAAEQTSESVVTSVDLPGDEMKGRIIGREGRNIRSFEQITGVNVLIDDTPEMVLLSCFDPVRREAARMTLTDLVADGRIHPARIEEVHERNMRLLEERIRRTGEQALVDVGITDLHEDLVPVVGSLAYRTSFGQNVLAHLSECAHLAGVMAAELGLDVAQCKRAAFLHDIGKALTHETEGPHALIGADLLRRHGEHEDIVHAVEAHHNEVPPRTVEAILTQAADAISGARPGARRESLEAYVERMQNLESIAMAHEGVTRAYAMQAGREVRIMVAPEVVDDQASHVLAKEIAGEVQKNLTYPGQIRITVVRESRATELAH
ncbi:ribonuclease Y [Arachnia propionica]|uniref:ribonuclease Y n=1 Tax=Arachnia propionica TaxID=1750 RepID=UPI001C89853C|nr:ribonuclease Y [Arachnia propionica]MDO5083119.1 ribonuclease Y [Arachnia propionica]